MAVAIRVHQSLTRKRGGESGGWAGLSLVGQSPFSNQMQISNYKVLFSFELIQIQN
jgi:hypothetical protein